MLKMNLTVMFSRLVKTVKEQRISILSQDEGKGNLRVLKGGTQCCEVKATVKF